MTNSLRDLLAAPGCLALPGVYDGISARMATHVGFDALYMTGYGSVASALETTATLLRRGDRAALAQDGIDELKARGRLALARHATAAPAYLEVLAQHVETSRGLHND